MKTFPAELSPLLIGAARMGAGLVLRQVQPDALNLPERPDRMHTDRGLQRAARKTHDGIARFLPGSLTGRIGRSLTNLGAGLVIVRLLDMSADVTEAAS